LLFARRFKTANVQTTVSITSIYHPFGKDGKAMYENLKTEISELRKLSRKSKPIIEAKRAKLVTPKKDKSVEGANMEKERIRFNVFRKEDVIESHRLEELLAARDKNERLCDFLYKIGPGATEQEKLKSWKEWLTLSALMVQSLVNFAYNKISVPWAITLSHGNYVLWKIDEALDVAGIREERKKPRVRWYAEMEK